MAKTLTIRETNKYICQRSLVNEQNYSRWFVEACLNTSAYSNSEYDAEEAEFEENDTEYSAGTLTGTRPNNQEYLITGLPPGPVNIPHRP